VFFVQTDPNQNSVGSLDLAKRQLEKGALVKALRTLRRGGYESSSLKPDLDACITKLYATKAYGVILSGYYTAGVIGQYSVEELLNLMWFARDIPSFLKQAYRFDALDLFPKEIEEAIRWHETRRMPDASAWRVKFIKLQEQRQLGERPLTGNPPQIVLEDRTDEDIPQTSNFLELNPLTATSPYDTVLTQELVEDPYIISQTARVKYERANSEHTLTITALCDYLARLNKAASKSRLIDAFALLTGGPAIFEVKSITELNEREQVRHALSQLYEYRYLHRQFNASLWIVFSREPFSEWIIDYLIQDRCTNVIWKNEGGKLVGPSMPLLE